MTKKNSSSRRKLLQSLVLGGTVAAVKALPDTWTTPIVNSVLLPAHAALSPGECAFYAVSGFPVPEFAEEEGISSELTVCAVVCEGEPFATVTHQTAFFDDGQIPTGPWHFARRTGSIPVDGSEGGMAATLGPNCDQEGFGGGVMPATLTNLTSQSVVYTIMNRGEQSEGDLVVTLLRTVSCPVFPPLSDCEDFDF